MTGYNLYGLHFLSQYQTDALAERMPKGLKYRLGGQEYTEHYYPTTEFLSRLKKFLKDVDGTVLITANEDFVSKDPAHIYNSLINYTTDEVIFGNEYWFDIEKFENIIKDLFTYLFNKKEYYRKGAKKYVEDGYRMVEYMRSKGLDVKPIFNTPLPQNQFLSTFCVQVKSMTTEKLSIHVYGKPWEHGYFNKLASWLSFYSNRETICGEFNGIALHEIKNYEDYKNKPVHYEFNSATLQLLANRGITDYYYMNLCANEHMLRFSNPPVYYRYLVKDNYQITETL